MCHLLSWIRRVFPMMTGLWLRERDEKRWNISKVSSLERMEREKLWPTLPWCQP